MEQRTVKRLFRSVGIEPEHILVVYNGLQPT